MELPDRCRFFLTERGVELGSPVKKTQQPAEMPTLPQLFCFSMSL